MNGLLSDCRPNLTDSHKSRLKLLLTNRYVSSGNQYYDKYRYWKDKIRRITIKKIPDRGIFDNIRVKHGNMEFINKQNLIADIIDMIKLLVETNKDIQEITEEVEEVKDDNLDYYSVLDGKEYTLITLYNVSYISEIEDNGREFRCVDRNGNNTQFSYNGCGYKEISREELNNLDVKYQIKLLNGIIISPEDIPLLVST